MSHRTTSRRRTARAGQARASFKVCRDISTRGDWGVFLCRATDHVRVDYFSSAGTVAASLGGEVTADLLNIPSTHTLPSAITMIVLVSGLIVRKRAAHCSHRFSDAWCARSPAIAHSLWCSPRDHAEGPYFLLDGRYALHRVCVRWCLSFLDSFGVPARIGRLVVGAAATAAGGILLTTLVLWYLCHIGVWEPLRSVTPWELLMHGMGIERTHPGVWSADVVAFLASFRLRRLARCGTVPVGARVTVPRMRGPARRS